MDTQPTLPTPETDTEEALSELEQRLKEMCLKVNGYIQSNSNNVELKKKSQTLVRRLLKPKPL